jgi:pimeloyl-ACP methyl ester carboxylesterase
MGSSDKPAGGYEKKSMAIDLSALVDQLGYEKVDVVGHDIGAKAMGCVALGRWNPVSSVYWVPARACPAEAGLA